MEDTKGTVIRNKSEELYKEKDGCFVTRDGRIFKVHGKTGKCHKVKQSVVSAGYLQFWLNDKMVSSHRFIWSAFFGEIPEGMQINHKDENKQNNNIENLELCDAFYNNNYGTHNERAAKAKSKPVNQYNMDWTLVATYPSANEAARQTGFNCGRICDCCNGKRKSHKDYIWRYSSEETTL